MASSLPFFVLGYHGCDLSVGEKVLANQEKLDPSINDYDWLGNGVCSWENSPSRALEYAESIKENPHRGKTKITHPFVLGAILDLGYCLNLLDTEHLLILREGYDLLRSTSEAAGRKMPKNVKPIGEERDLLLRHLDCAVVETVHSFNGDTKRAEFDSVRGVFVEGEPLYENSGFHSKNHIQICVRNYKCIRGFFRPIS